MGFKYKLSIIVPCYNSSKTIGRLLDSIVSNNLNKSEYELIIVDDNSTDNFMDIVNNYKELINIAYYKTDTKVHCPGNTRQVGLENANGEWIVFADHDDYFEPGSFKEAFDIIDMNNIDTILCTQYAEIRENDEKIYCDGMEHFNMLHGKLYNHQMLIDGNIRFKEDLKTCEDSYFNNKIIAHLVVTGKMAHNTTDVCLYNWIQLDDSVSHEKEGNLLYMDIHFGDFIYATIVPILELPDSFYEYKFQNVLTNFLVLYFLYEEGSYIAGNEYPLYNRECMSNIKKEIINNLNINNYDIIKFVYSNPKLYNQKRLVSFDNSDFIETESFKDFVFNLDKWCLE